MATPFHTRCQASRISPARQCATARRGPPARPGAKPTQSFERSDAYRAEVHTLIPGGAHTYSKGDDQFPQLAPAAIEGSLVVVRAGDGRLYGLDAGSFAHILESFPLIAPAVREAAMAAFIGTV